MLHIDSFYSWFNALRLVDCIDSAVLHLCLALLNYVHSWKHDESRIENPNRLALFHLLRSDISCSISSANEHESNNIKSCPSNGCWHLWPASTSYLVLGPYHENMCMYMYTNVIYLLHICMYINVDVSVLYPLFRLKVLQAGTVDVMNLKGLRFAPSETPNQPSTGSEWKSKADDAGCRAGLWTPCTISIHSLEVMFGGVVIIVSDGTLDWRSAEKRGNKLQYVFPCCGKQRKQKSTSDVLPIIGRCQAILQKRLHT